MGNAASDGDHSGNSNNSAAGCDNDVGGSHDNREWLRVALHDLHDPRRVASLLARLPPPSPPPSSIWDGSSSGSILPSSPGGHHRLMVVSSNDDNDPSVLYSSGASPPSTPPSAGTLRRLTRAQSRALYIDEGKSYC